jgi:hypothetical protein
MYTIKWLYKIVKIIGADKKIIVRCYIYKTNNSRCLLFMMFRGSLSKYPVTLVQYLVWVCDAGV